MNITWMLWLKMNLSTPQMHTSIWYHTIWYTTSMTLNLVLKHQWLYHTCISQYSALKSWSCFWWCGWWSWLAAAAIIIIIIGDRLFGGCLGECHRWLLVVDKIVIVLKLGMLLIFFFCLIISSLMDKRKKVTSNLAILTWHVPDTYVPRSKIGSNNYLWQRKSNVCGLRMTLSAHKSLLLGTHRIC